MDRNSKRRGKSRVHNLSEEKKTRQKLTQQHSAFFFETRRNMVEKEKAIKNFKSRRIICPLCGEMIHDMSSAIADKISGNPAHFDCVLSVISKTEKVKNNERISYIGQGRFAVLSYENSSNLHHFTIERIIEWEERNKVFMWRSEMAGLFSQIK